MLLNQYKNYKMDIIFINSENKNVSNPHTLLLNLTNLKKILKVSRR